VLSPLSALGLAFLDFARLGRTQSYRKPLKNHVTFTSRDNCHLQPCSMRAHSLYPGDKSVSVQSCSHPWSIMLTQVLAAARVSPRGIEVCPRKGSQVMPSRLSTSGFAPPIHERTRDQRDCLPPSTSGCRCNLRGPHHQQCRSQTMHGLYIEDRLRVSTTMLTRLVKIALPVMGVALTILLSYSSAPAQVIDKNIYLPPQYQTLAPPAEGASYVDPAFGTSIKRISNALAQPNFDRGGMLTFITDEYSTMSSFNQDNSKILLVFQSYFGLYDGTGAFLKNCPLEVSASSGPRWSRTDRDVFYYHRGNRSDCHPACLRRIRIHYRKRRIRYLIRWESFCPCWR